MSKIVLFEHNEKAYELLINTLKNKRFATINHATGTGKSFIALKYLYENRDKKCLYISPTYPIIDQLMDSCEGIGINSNELNVDTMIYRNLLKMDIEKIFEKYDVIILDEYHRAGAKETYKQIKRLKALIAQSKNDKKMIGLTATPVRFLDKERNMTEEIFDNVVASSLSLSEAMLEGLLPVPMVINSKISCRTPCLKMKHKMKKLAPGKSKALVEDKLKNIGEKIDNGEKEYQDLLKKHIKEKDGKYVVFCSTIEEAQKYYALADKWFEHIGEIKKYQVHSGFNKEKNKQTLSEFNSDSKGMSLLFCVDVLNEGVHVKGIDGVIMLRKTTSPIIYFQQIGRALSFSGRKKQIKIFDLVNNFANHNAIYAIYKELKEELKRKSELNPQNRARYQAVLDKFVILDETRDIIEELSSVAKELTREKIIQSRVEYAVDLLINSSNLPLNDQVEKEIEEANLILERYYKFVDNEQLDKLLELDILLPKALVMNLEERNELLQGYSSIYEKEKNDFESINLIIKFIDNNKRIPSAFSDFDSEKKLGKIYLDHVSDFSNEQKVAIKDALKRNKVELQPWEKSLLDEKMNETDLDKLINLANVYINNEKELPKYLYESLHNCIIKYEANEQVEKIYEVLEKSDSIYRKRLKPRAEEEKKVKELVNSIKQNIDKLDDEEFINKLQMGLSELSARGRMYIELRIERLKKEVYKDHIHLEDETTLKHFCATLKDKEDFEIKEYYDKLLRSRMMHSCIARVVDFKKANYGRMPDVQSSNPEEAQLAIKFAEYVESGDIDEKIVNALVDGKTRIFTRNDDCLLIKKIVEDNQVFIEEQIEFFSDKYIEAKKNYYRSLLYSEEKISLKDFCEMMKEINDSLIKLLRKKIEGAKEKNLGILDSLDKDATPGDDFEELKNKMARKAIEEEENDIFVKENILDVVEFFQNRGRRPLPNSRNKEESEMANVYNTISKKHLTSDCIDILNKLFNSRKNLLRTCDEYLKNLLDK